MSFCKFETNALCYQMVILFADGVDRNNQAIKRCQYVRVLDNAEIVKRLMGNAWHDGLQSAVGKIGKITMFDENGNVFVYFRVLRRPIMITPKALTLVTSGKLLHN